MIERIFATIPPSLIVLFSFLMTFYSCKKHENADQETFAHASISMGTIPDFSFAGYMNSEEAIPNVPVVFTLEPRQGNNYHFIQNTINLLASKPLVNGFRGAILLKAGVYEISDPLYIRASGIVIRGEGQHRGGTTLLSTKQYKYQQLVQSLQRQAVINIIGNTGGPLNANKAETKIVNNVKVANVEIEVEKITGFEKGDNIIITKTTNQDWVTFLGMDKYGWDPSYFQISHKRVIKDIVANSIILNIPMVDDINLEHGGGTITVVKHEDLIENSAVENIRFDSVYEGDEDENHIWSAINLNGTKNCWVRNITAENLALSAVAIFNSEQITVQDCAIFNFKSKPIGDRRYPFFLDINCTGVLFQRCYSDGARHPLITGPKIAGPNVFLDCYAQNSSSDTGPHNRWATGTLYDNIYSDMIYARNAENTMGHGWTGAYNMFWNNFAEKGFLIQDPPGARNWLVGGRGRFYSKSSSQDVSPKMRVVPRSLFIDQLINRIGITKSSQIIHSSQLGANHIWDELKNWAGESKPIELPNYSSF